MAFTHLHVHTEYSMLDGAAKLAPLVAEAARTGMPALGMTDHGNLHGAYDFHRQATAAGIKPVIGIEAYVAPASRHHKKPVHWGTPAQRSTNETTGMGGDVSGNGAYLHMTLLAENATGLRNLFRLSSLASLQGAYRQPRMDKEILAEYHAGIIATTGCPGGEVQTRLRLGQYDQALKAAADWRDIFGKDNFFLEIMDHGLPIEAAVRADLLRIGHELGIPPLATNDSHYVHATDADTHDNLLCVGVGKTKDDPARFRFEGTGYYLKTPAEMRAMFDAEVPGACDNTLLIAERVGDYGEVFAHRDLMPGFPVPAGHTPGSFLRQQTYAGVRDRYGPTPPPAVTERVDYELGVIEEMGFPSYFLIVADICAEARRRGIAIGPGRGSVTGSMVAYVLRISELDPIEHRLLFERFLNPERVSMPDVDMDFDERHRAEMIDYVTGKYGADACAQIVTFNTIKAKAAVKDACRVLGYPYAIGDRITKAFPPAVQGTEIPLAAVFDTDHPRYGDAAPLRALYDTDTDAKQILDTAVGLEGLTRGTGVHPAGVILSAEPLIDVIPLSRRDSDGATITQFDYPTCESMGLLKMDFLGLRNLTIIDNCVKLVEAGTGNKLNLLELPLDDAATYRMLAGGHTLGIFQLDGDGMRKLLRMIKPTAFEDIAAVLALYRPGPMAADAHTNYALRKNGKQPLTPIHPELEEPLRDVLTETYGLIVYQEQVMAIAQKVAGYSLGGADLLRRAMGKKKKAELDKQYETFESGMCERGFSAAAIKALWDILLPFSSYAFNKCATGDTQVTRLGRGSHEWPQTLRNLANRIHGREDYDGSGCRYCYEDRPVKPRTRECKPCASWRAKWKMKGGMNAAGRVGNRILPVKIVDVFRQGVKPVWKMTLANGLSITTTANHRHLTPDGWRRLDQLASGDTVCTMDEGEWGVASDRTEYVGEGKDWPKKYGYQIHGRHAQYVRNVGALVRECAKCGSDEGRLEIAHLDGDPTNNAASNLAYLCNSCHKRHDYANGGRTKMWRKGRAIESSPIVSIEYVGEEMTYDVTVDSEDHSWVANGGIVTHNSHTAGYGLVAYWTAYFKANYPAEYMAALLTSVGDDKDRMALYLNECRRMGIKVLPPDVNDSDVDFTPRGSDVRFGLSAVRNVGTGVVDGIITARKEKGRFVDFKDFLRKAPAVVCHKRPVESLIKSGAFDSLGHPRKGLARVHEQAVDAISGIKKNEAIGQDSLFDMAGGEDHAVDVPPIPPGEWDKATLLGFEREMLGLYVSDHPLADAEDVLRRNRDTTIAGLLDGSRADGPARICGLVTNVSKRSGKNGPWALATVEDLTGSIDVLLFKSYPLYADILVNDALVSVSGQAKTRDGAVSLFASDLRTVDVAARPAGGPVVVSIDEDKLTPALVADMRDLLSSHKGEVPVQLAVRRGGRRTTLMELPGYAVDPGPAFEVDMKVLVGPGWDATP